jgi:penicillin-binding protein 1A
MGRDDNKVVPGLQGGTAPARAFHDFMIRAVANRPVENFETQVKPPDWQQEPDDEAWYAAPDNGAAPQQLVDPDGNPLPAANPRDEPDGARAPRDQDQNAPPPPPERLDRDFLDRAVNDELPPRRPPTQRRRSGEPLPPLPGQRPSAPGSDEVERRPFAPQP